MMANVAGLASVIDPARPRMEQILELKQAVLECYCGLGPACPLWRQMTPEQRTDCSTDKRLVAQRFWKNCM
jgi:hypothetical protein